MGDAVSAGVPGPGAGSIESPGAQDMYTFTVKPGERVYFQVKESNVNVHWRVVDEVDKVIFDTCLGCGDPGVQTLTRGGTYTITVGSDRSPATGTYQFQLNAQP